MTEPFGLRPTVAAMSKLSTHIHRGEHTRMFFCLVSALAVALFMISSGAARGDCVERRLPVAAEAVRPAAPDSRELRRPAHGLHDASDRGRPDDRRRQVRLSLRRRHLGAERDGGLPGRQRHRGPRLAREAPRVRRDPARGTAAASSTGTCAPWSALASAAEAGATVLGTIMAPFEHVHFAEIKSGSGGQPTCSRVV